MLSDGRDEKGSKDGQDSDWIEEKISKDAPFGSDSYRFTYLQLQETSVKVNG